MPGLAADDVMSNDAISFATAIRAGLADGGGGAEAAL
jgi:hypothetical protein